MALKWGICSAGNISYDFSLALQYLGHEKHQIVAVAARDLEKAKEFASKFCIPKAYGDYKELAEDTDVEIVYIGTLNAFHIEPSLLMLEAGKHVLCEKPMTLNLKEAKLVLKKAKEMKLFFMEGIWSRFTPVYERIRENLSDGTIGDIKMVQVEFGELIDIESRLKNGVGGGATLDIGVYCIQFATMAFGLEKPLKITASGHKNDEGVDVVGNVTLLYSGGRTACLTYTFTSKLANRAVIHGTKGKLEIPSIFWTPTKLITPQETYNFDLPKYSAKPVFNNGENLIYEADAVRSSLLKGETEHPLVPHSESLLIMSIMDEIRKQIGVTYAGEY